MTTPPFVPPPPPTRLPRRSDFAGIPPARHWSPRPGEVLRQPHGPGLGLPCPDAGYAFLLAHHSEPDLILEPRERCQDASWAIATIAVRHAGGLGRAPCIHDVALGRSVLAYDGGGPVEFSHWRANSLSGITRNLELQQRLTNALEALPNPADADALRGWWAALPELWEADPILLTRPK
jgi:hypothetical protein